MGDRVIIVVTSAERDKDQTITRWHVSPAIYLHWGASDAPALIKRWEGFMADRMYDLSYAAARLIGIAHSEIVGRTIVPEYATTGLGVWNLPQETVDLLKLLETTPAADVPAEALEAMDAMSQGDGGVVVYNVERRAWVAYGGYLAEPIEDEPDAA